MRRWGAPRRLLTDRGPYFRAATFQRLLGRYQVRHILTRPGHVWTNGRIERLFRTLKESLRTFVWLIGSRRHLDRLAADFVCFYNRDRPHSSWGGRTPNEVFFDRSPPRRPRRRVEYFDGRLRWYALG